MNVLLSSVTRYAFFIKKKYDDTISTYNPHFSPPQAAKHSGQGTSVSKIVSSQMVPWGWIPVIKPGNCYEPYEKTLKLMPFYYKSLPFCSLCLCNNFFEVIIKNILGLGVIINMGKIIKAKHTKRHCKLNIPLLLKCMCWKMHNKRLGFFK